MKIKGLAKLEESINDMQEDIQFKIDGLDQDHRLWEERDNALNDAWNCCENMKEEIQTLHDL